MNNILSLVIAGQPVPKERSRMGRGKHWYNPQSDFMQILKTNIKNFNVKQKGWHLDHIYSISDGWRNNIDPTIVGHFVNLRYVTAKENCTKNKKSDFTKETLYELYEQNK